MNGNNHPVLNDPNGPLAGGIDVRDADRDAVAPARPQRVYATAGTRRTRRAAAKAATPLPSPRDLLYVLFRHRIRASVVAITLFTLALLAALVLPSKYTSESQLLVRMGRENLPQATVAGGPQMVQMVDQTTQSNSEAQILRSREVVEATVRQVGVETILNEKPSADPSKRAAQESLAARQLAAAVEVKTEPMSAIIKVTYDDKSPTRARDVVQAYVNAYLDHRAKIYGSGGAGNLFAGLTQTSEEKLRSIETSIKALKDQTAVSDVDTQKTILLNRIASLQSQADTIGAALASTIKRIESIENQLATTPKQIPLQQTKREPNGVVSNAEGDLNKLKLELDQKMTTYLPTSPVVVQLQDQIARAEKRLKELELTSEAQTLGLNPTWSELDRALATERTNLDGRDAELKSIVAELAKAKQGQAVINDVELQMGQLAREQGMVVDQLKKVVEGRNFTTIDEAMGKDRVGSVEPSQLATLPAAPSSPNRKLLVLFGLFAALVGGVGTALASEVLDSSVNKPQDLKRLGFGRVVSIPALRMGGALADGEVGLTVSPETQAIVDLGEHDTSEPPTPQAPSSDRLRPSRYVRSTPRLTSVLMSPLDTATTLSPRELLQQWKSRPTPAPAAAAPQTTYVVDAPSSRPTLSPRFMEACHSLLERLVFAPVATNEFPMPRSIAVVGLAGGQGASTLAAHLAAALADHLPNGVEGSESGRVLLVDANLAAPAQHRIFDAQNEPGISDWIRQPADAAALGDYARPTALPKLDLLTAGAASVGHQPGRWTDAVGVALRSDYHCVVVDLPNMARAEATARAAGACDAAILVVECGATHREVVRQAAQRLAESGVRLLGVVLNKRTYPIPEKLYRYV